MFTAFDPLLIATALLVMVAGFGRRWSSWRMGRSEDRSGDWRGLWGYLLSHGKILKRGRAGIAHLLLFWGALVPLTIVVLAQFAFVLPPGTARALSLFMDLVGAAAVAGILFFLIRRVKGHEAGAPARTLLPAFLLLFILLSGFTAEGIRLNLVPATFWTAPAGRLFSLVSPSSPLALQLVIRMHFFAVLCLVALLPFTFMRHAAAGTLNVYYRRKGPRGALRPLPIEEGRLGAKTVEDLSWKQLLDAEACVSCGRCEENCPAFLSGKPLSPRKVIRSIYEQMTPTKSPPPLLSEAVTAEEIWSCTGCLACVAHCPLYIEPMDKVVELRRYATLGRGALPAEARPMIRNVELFGDVNGKGVAHKTDWALNLGVPLLSALHETPEVLLWVGCSGAFHPRSQATTRAMVRILEKGKVSFGILGGEESCCGDPARRLGEESLFVDLALKNIRRLNRYPFAKVVTLCPHCFNVLKNEYPGLAEKRGEPMRTGLKVLHGTEFVLDLLQQKRITLKYPLRAKAAIHDPCYLGRANGIYEPLRTVAKSVPGLDLMELERTGEKAFCCGGGGGGMWLHQGSGTHINALRSEEIAESGVGLVSTACPYCLTMLEDGLNGLELEKTPKVRDIIDIVSYSLG